MKKIVLAIIHKKKYYMEIKVVEIQNENAEQGGIIQALYATPAWACYLYLIYLFT